MYASLDNQAGATNSDCGIERKEVNGEGHKIERANGRVRYFHIVTYRGSTWIGCLVVQWY